MDELESEPIVLNQEDAQELDAQAQKYLDGRSSFPPNRDAQAGEPLRTSKYEHNLSSNSMQKIPHGTLPSSNNNENDPPSDLPVASDSDTPRTPIKGRMHLPGTIMPTKGHARRPGPVKGRAPFQIPFARWEIKVPDLTPRTTAQHQNQR